MGTLNIKSFGFLLLISVLGSCTSIPLPSAGTDIPDDFAGMVHAGQSKTAEEYALLDELGVNWILATFYWSSIEPEQGRWDFSDYDSFADTGKKAGEKILAVLAYDTPFLRPNGERRKYISSEHLPLFLNFVEQTVRRYRGQVDVWQIWNEPNWIFWRGTNKEFYEFAKAAVQKIREVDPDAVIAGGAFWRTPSAFIRGMFKSGAMDGVNTVCFHPYALNPRYVAKQYDRMAAILENTGYTGDIWVTEIGYPTGGWYPNRVSEKNLPAYVVKTMASLAARGAQKIFWYELYDKHNQGQSTTPLNSEGFFGLVFPDGTQKPGAQAYALCARYLAGARYEPELPHGISVPQAATALYFHGDTGNNTLVLWKDKSTALTFRISLPGDGTLHDVVTGSGEAIPRNAVITLKDMPLIITWQANN
jgi:hypothetical protein